MKNVYQTVDEASQDKANLIRLMEAMAASPSSLRRNDAGLWILRGHPGCYAATWGDGETWQLVVAPEQEISKQAWTWIKKRLAFAEVTQDGDAEGCFRLHRLPTAAEAEVIRDIIGIRKRIDFSPEELARRQGLGRRLANEKWGCRPIEGDQNERPVLDPHPQQSTTEKIEEYHE